MKKLDQTVIFLFLSIAIGYSPKKTTTTTTKFTDLKTKSCWRPKTKTSSENSACLRACFLLLPSPSFLACFLPWVWLFLARSSSACFCWSFYSCLFAASLAFAFWIPRPVDFFLCRFFLFFFVAFFFPSSSKQKDFSSFCRCNLL